MFRKHIIELLIETNKQISNIISKLEKEDSQDNQVIIDQVNDSIRQLDNIVEQLEKK